MANMDEIYDALRTANANGDKASVEKLSDYINSQPSVSQAAPSAAAPQATLKQGGTSPTEWLTEKIAPVISHIPVIGSSDEIANYQKAKRLAGVANMIPFWGSAEPGYQAGKEFSAIGPELGRGEYGNAALSTGAAGLNTAASLAASLPFIGKPAQEFLGIGAQKLIGALSSGAGTAGKVMAPAGQKIANTASTVYRYGRESAPLIAETKTEAQKVLETLQQLETAKSGTAQQAANASKEAINAERTRMTLARTLQNAAEKKAAAATEAAAPVEPFGQPKYLTERGQGPQDTVVQAKDDIIDHQYKQDAILRPKFEQIVAEKEAAGKSLSDLRETKALLKESKDALNPNVTTSNVATSLPSEPEAKLHQMVVNALERRRVYLTPKEAKIADANGFPVKIDKATGNAYREFKTSAESLENLNRRLGDAAFGQIAEGFDGVPTALAKNYYYKTQPIIDKFSKGASAATRENWRTALEQLKPYQNTPIGKAIAGELPETAVKQLNPATGKWEEVSPAIQRTVAANVPSAITRGGQGTFEQFLALSKNPDEALKFANNEIDAVFYNPTSGKSVDYDTAMKTIGPNTKLGDIVNGLPKVLGSEGSKLKTAIDKHLQDLLDAKMSEIEAPKWTSQASKYKEKTGNIETKIGQLSTARGTQISDAAKAEDARRSLTQLYNDLSSPDAKPANILTNANSAFDKAHQAGIINDAKHKALINTITTATKKYGQTQTRNKIILGVLSGLGIGEVSNVTYKLSK